MNRIEKIKLLIEEQLQPEHCEVIDDAAEHIGHAGASTGAGHYTIKITSKALSNLSRVQAHQRVYQALGNMIPNEIHAVRIQLV